MDIETWWQEREQWRRLQRGDDPAPLLAELFARPEWHERAACRGMVEVFFPTRGTSTQEAKQVCASCPVLADCRHYAESTPVLDSGAPLEGIWAGMSRQERRLVRSGGALPSRERSCVECGRSFVARVANAKLCGSECRAVVRARRAREKAERSAESGRSVAV